LIANAYGDDAGNIYDINDKQVYIANVQAVSSIRIIDVIACSASKNITSWQAIGVQDIRTYNPLPPSSEIWWNQTNDVTQVRISESIRNGADTFGPPTVTPMPVSSLLFAVGSNTQEPASRGSFRAVRIGNTNKNVVVDPTVK
jgi:hypothetical protein